MVVYGHQYALMGVGGRCPLMLGNPVSTIGVKMIFVITGFLITQSFLREQNLGQFLKRRLIRIYPALICCVVVCTLALSLFSTFNLADYFRCCWQYLLKNLALQPVYVLPGVFENNPYPNAVNGSLWTLPVEVAMYFFVGIALWLFTRFCDKVFRIGYTAVVLAVVMAEAVKANKPWSVNVFFVLSLIPVIGLACLSHRFVEKPMESFLKSKLLKRKAVLSGST